MLPNPNISEKEYGFNGYAHAVERTDRTSPPEDAQPARDPEPMSSATRDRYGATLGSDELPVFELDYLFDDRDRPTEVTVFPAEDTFDISTNWITIDIDHAVPLDRIR